MNCKGCTCINQSHSKKQFCGKKITTQGKNAFFGCNTDCQECQSCNYSDFATGDYKNYEGKGGSQNNNLRNYNNNNYENKGPLNKKGFLNFLKRQREMNVEQGLIKRENIKNNKINNRNNSDLESYMYNVEKEEEYRENINNMENSIESCGQKRKNNCYNVDGCYWDERGMQCKDMEVSFFTVQGLENISFNLPIGNYDRKDVDNFDFVPSYILVPLGLRVKIWPKEGFVGNEKSYSGNISNQNQDPEMKNKLMYKLSGPIGSIQICNVDDCIKPSQYDNLKLINILDGNNIDNIENLGVSGLEGYRNKLRQNIRNRLNFINVQYASCLESVKNYLKQNDIDLKNEIDNIEDIFELQKIKYILNNLPSCNDLVIFKNSNINNNNNNKNNNNNNNNNNKNNKNNLDMNNSPSDMESDNKVESKNKNIDLVTNSIFGEDEEKNKVSLLVIFVISLLVFLCIVLGIIQYKQK